MTGKKAKQLRKKSKILLVEWLQSIVPDKKEAEKITIKNLNEYLSEDTHIFVNNRSLLSAFSLRWVYKKLKKNPDLTIEELQKNLLI